MALVLANIFERLLGLDPGFFNRPGELSLDFNPKWPTEPLVNAGAANYVIGAAVLVALAASIRLRPVERSSRRALRIGQVLAVLFLFMLLWGTVAWNVALALLTITVLLYVYSHEGRSRPARVSLGIFRAALMAFVLFLLNNPVLTLSQSRTEPSVLAVMVDDSVSMRVKDVGEAADSPTRLAAAIDLLTGEDAALIKALARKHQVRFYKFNRDARPLGVSVGTGVVTDDDDAAKQEIKVEPAVLETIRSLEAEGQSTQVARSVVSVLDDLQGQRVAGVVVLSDGRDSPTTPLADLYKQLQDYGVRIYPVAVGSDRTPMNVDLQSIAVQDSAFKDDIVSFKMTLRAAGMTSGQSVKLTLKDKKTGRPLRTAEGAPAEKMMSVGGDGNPQEEEILFKPEQEGPLEIVAEAEKQPGELDENDNARTTQISVLDAKIAVLYVDGYPRWDYRYIKNEMIRDKTVLISCLLTSADPSFAQEGDPPTEKFPGPIRRFPESIEELMAFDVVIFGDVDPRQFTDSQLQLIHDFVEKKGGGFGMVAGPRWSPAAFRNTVIDIMLPVNISRVEPDPEEGQIIEGFRPVVTKDGLAGSVFRFFADPKANERYLAEEWQPVFWYAAGLTTKPGVGEVYAEHPAAVGPDGRKSPILVVGRYGAGRTLFSAIDDSWRWRFYTGENIFDTYWIQQLRHLARSKKLGQRRLTFVSNRPVYELGDQTRVTLRVLDPVLLQQLPAEIRVEVLDETDRPVRTERLTKLEGQSDTYEASFTAERLGRYRVKLPPFSGEAAGADLSYEVIVPRLELNQPQVDRQLVTRLASETLGQPVAFNEARQKLPELIASAAKIIPIQTSEPLWDAPLAMWIFVLLITGEWVLRKAYGML